MSEENAISGKMKEEDEREAEEEEEQEVQQEVTEMAANSVRGAVSFR
jgi:hypothetical protein